MDSGAGRSSRRAFAFSNRSLAARTRPVDSGAGRSLGWSFAFQTGPLLPSLVP